MKDGGQAFPFSAPVEFGALPLYGMSLRDWFAGQALAGMSLPDDRTYSQGDHERHTPQYYANLCAIAAYRLADAMLAERDKPREEST
jgi:hypothetical protein